MGTDSIPDRSDGQVIDEDWFDVIQRALKGDLVPRNSSGAATDVAGSLGTASYRWLKARIASGYWSLGDIKLHHSYNGAAGPGHGWMLCDGRQVTEANYNTEHGASTWATYVVSSPLLNKHLPNAADKYPVGKATTTQDGSSAIIYVGNASNQVDLSHGHSIANGSPFEWYKSNSGTTDDQVFGDSTPIGDPHYNVVKGASKNSLSILVGNSNTINGILGAGTVGPLNHSGPNPTVLYTEASHESIGSGGSATQSIQPHSFEVQYYMRIID